LEEAALRWLDFQGEALEVLCQPLELRFEDGRRHVPDILARMRDGSCRLIDVSMERMASNPRRAEAFRRTRAVCEWAGWDYRVESELDPVVAANVEWLSVYRQPSAGFRRWAPVILKACEGPKEWRQLAGLGSSPFLIPALGHLIWIHALGFDIDAPLRETTVIARLSDGVRNAVCEARRRKEPR
jgi:hypothetical protein